MVLLFFCENGEIQMTRKILIVMLNKQHWKAVTFFSYGNSDMNFKQTKNAVFVCTTPSLA
jgi:hypothetical protein